MGIITISEKRRPLAIAAGVGFTLAVAAVDCDKAKAGPYPCDHGAIVAASTASGQIIAENPVTGVVYFAPAPETEKRVGLRVTDPSCESGLGQGQTFAFEPVSKPEK
jgi:hypothetical protein